MTAHPRWARYVTYVAPAELLLLITQYLLGLWTNVYGPAVFSSNTSLPSLNAHFFVGDLLFLVGVVLLAFAGLSRQGRLVAPSAVLVATVFIAGMFGMAFLHSSPNNPVYSFAMGSMFLIALFSTLVLTGLWRWRMGASVPEKMGATPAPPNS